MAAVPPTAPTPYGSVKCPACNHEFLIKSDPKTTPNASVVLSLDGGGIKGYSSLLILQSLMRAVLVEERRRDPDISDEELQKLGKPSVYFEYIIGTSTGGLIAIMLGRLNLTVETCIQEYQELGDQVFGHPRKVHVHNKMWAGSKYDYRIFEAVIKRIIDKHKRPEDSDEFGRGSWSHFKEAPPEDAHFCKTAAVAARNRNRIPNPYLFRSYIHPPGFSGRKSYSLNPGIEGCSMEIWEVARATSAAPGYFKTFTMANSEHEFMDGGICANNPSMIAWNEAWHMAQVKDPTISAAMAIGYFVSIGTGKSEYSVFGRKNQLAVSKYLNMNKAPRKMITNTDPTHKDVEKMAESHGTPYFRFNVQEGLESMMLDEWAEKKRPAVIDSKKISVNGKIQTLQYLDIVTKNYLAPDNADSQQDPSSNVADNIGGCAKLLVDYRRSREEARRNSNQMNGGPK